MDLVQTFILCLVTAAVANDADVKNKFYARFYPRELDPNHEKGYYTMPRTTSEARADGWNAVANQKRSDHTTLWVHRGDYRVGLLFDKRGSVAGIQLSVSKAALKKSGVPLRYDESDYWFAENLLGVDVYTAVAYFVGQNVLSSGGRVMVKATPTAPQFQLLYKSRKGKVSRLPVPNTERAMLKQNWIKQGCYPGQGYHIYQTLSHKASCMNFLPFFFITSPTNQEFTSFGFTIWGKGEESPIRPWFENQLSANLKSVVTDKPACFDPWIDTYGLWALHIFFEKDPWNVKCI